MTRRWNALLLTIALAPACGQGATDANGVPLNDGGVISTGDAAHSGDGSSNPGPTSCPSGANILTPGQALTFSSTPGGTGNTPRDYCFLVPPGKTEIQLALSGGNCNCSGDDVHMFLKQGAQPDAFDPDASTKAWTYTPATSGMGMYGKSAVPGVWFLSMIDDANTLGYKNVKLTLTLK